MANVLLNILTRQHAVPRMRTRVHVYKIGSNFIAHKFISHSLKLKSKLKSTNFNFIAVSWELGSWEWESIVNSISIDPLPFAIDCMQNAIAYS